jgi:hypothetical protein
MDTKIPAPLKAYLKKGNETKPKENKMIYPTYKPDQPEIIVVKKNKKRKSKKEKKGKKEKSDSKADIVIHRYKDEYPHIAYIPYSIPQMSAPNFPQQFPQQQQQQQFPPQFRDNRVYHDNRAFAENVYYGIPRPPEEMPDGEIRMENIFPQRQPQPYPFVNVPPPPLMEEDGYEIIRDEEIPMENMFPFRSSYSLINDTTMIQPLNPASIDDYQIERNLANIPIPVPNPILPDIPLEPVRVEKLSGIRRRPKEQVVEPKKREFKESMDLISLIDNRRRPDPIQDRPAPMERVFEEQMDIILPIGRRRPDPIQDEPEPNSSERIFDVQLDIIPPIFDMIPAPDLPVFEERRPENELLSQSDLEEMFLEEQLRAFEMNKREDIGISPRPPSPPNTPTSPDTTIAERIDRRRENTGRPREPLSQEESQLIANYVEIINTIAPQNRTPEQIDLLNRGRIVYKSKIRNHKEEVEEIKKRIEELIVKEGRQYRKKK